jgi:hypothetical protein
MASRLDTLENKNLYLVDTGFGGSYKFMLQLQKWLGHHIPSVTVIRKRKPGNVFIDDKYELWEQVETKGYAVVFGVSGSPLAFGRFLGSNVKTGRAAFRMLSLIMTGVY